MENSGAVTIEGENYEIVDECNEEEDTSNNGPRRSVKNMDIEKQSNILNKSIEHNESENKDENTNVKDNESVTAKKEKNASDIKKDKDENTKRNEKIPNTNSTDNALSNNSSSNDNSQNNMSNAENKCLRRSNVESIDFTADITLDQLDQQKDMTDEDVLLHLDEIENIVLDPTDFQIPKKEGESMGNNAGDQFPRVENNFIEQSNDDKNINADEKITCAINKEFKQEVKAVKSEKHDWYENKLIEKETIIKERLSKVAKVLGISYPCYEKWLEHEEKINGSPLCKLKPSRRCCLDKPYTNRWKFICNKKEVCEPITDTDNSDSSFNKNKKIVWKLEPSGAWSVNINNESQFPPFVLRAVKIFEDFLQTTEQLISETSKNVNFFDDVSIDVELKKEVNNEGRQNWLWLVVRCNSMDELMLFATGENVSRCTMDRLKQVYESGPGKDCNVKSLYCKSTNKYNDTAVTDTTFLVGSEALDEIVGGLKVQLAPKTNFWSNTAGAENVANAVIDLLAPSPKTTLLEIGCGIGLIGLMMASKCQQVIGVDSPSEVEEAEMTCELNNIKNASFIMGSPAEVTTKIIAAVKNRKTCAVINTNTNIGRAIEVMTALRKIPSLKRIVMITTLTKQSVRAILELARPGDHSHGSPFIPIVACVVDTLPIGPHFEAVILMQRRMINKFNQTWIQKTVGENSKNPEVKINQEKIGQPNSNQIDKKISSKSTELQTKITFKKSLIKYPAKKSKISVKKTFYVKQENPCIKNRIFKRKRSHSPDKGETPAKKLAKKFNKLIVKPWHSDLATKKNKEWEDSQLYINPFHEKKMREPPKEQIDLREKLSHNRLDTDIAQTLKEHQALLEVAKEKLSGPASTFDMNTAKQLQSMLNIVLEQTNKLQNQLPRSVWDRIASPGNMNSGQRENKQDDSLLKGRYVQEMGSQDILITMPNKKFLNSEETATKPRKYYNIRPLEPNTIEPLAIAIDPPKEEKSFHVTPERFARSFRVEVDQDRDKAFERNRWNEIGNMKRPVSPMRRQISPPKHRATPPPKRLSSSKRPLLSLPRRPCSPPRRHLSPLHRPISPMYRERSPIRRQMSPSQRPMSPRRMSPLRQPLSPRRPSPSRRIEMNMHRPMSPLRYHQVSRQMSPMRSTISSPSRKQSPMKPRPISPQRRQISSPNRMISLNNQEMLLSRRQPAPSQERQQISTMRRAELPHRSIFEHPTLSRQSPQRQQSPQRRQISPSRFVQDWDGPSRGTIEQQTTWIRPVERISNEQNIWRGEKTPTFNNSWEKIACSDKRRKTFNQEKQETAVKNPLRNDTWNNGENIWKSKQQMYAKPMMKETWSSNSNNRWSATSVPSSSNNNWNIRGKESLSTCAESWMDNKKQDRWESLNMKDSWKHCNKEDLNDLPEDAKDPWGDDGTSDMEERCFKLESAGTSNMWLRESEQQRGNSWTSKYNTDNWRNKGSSFAAKSQWQQNSNSQNVGESRWFCQNDIEKRSTSSSWQNGNTVGSWKFQNSNFQSQRPFSLTQFKSSY